jgi:hypothetical protein
MSNRKDKNLDELLKRLYGNGAKEVGEDIAKGERILREYPDPKPDEETIILLKAKVAKAVAANHERALRRTYYRVAAFAAAVIMIAFVSVQLLERKPVESVQVATTVKVTEGISQDDGFFNGEEEMATLSAEVEQVGDEIMALDFGVASEELDDDWIDVEMGLIDIENDFWKG